MTTHRTAVKVTDDGVDRGGSLTFRSFLEDSKFFWTEYPQREDKYHPASGELFISVRWIGRKERSSCTHWVVRFR
jgi:hypothetical protein